jgi:DNA-binding beta-propeller fold protein YncE
VTGYGTSMDRRLLVAAIAALAAAVGPGEARACTAAECYVEATTLGEAPATGSGVLRFPQAIAYTPGASTILVADQFGAVVQRFDRTGGWLGELGGYADARQLGRIGVVGGLATDRAGHVYVLDSENDRVQVFESATGRWLAAWGSTGQGAGQFRLGDNTGAGGIAVAQPTAAATPVAYVADQYNHRIQAFRLDRDASGDPGHPVLPAGTPAGDVVTAPTPSLQWGAHGDCSAGTCADPFYNQRFNYPQGVAVDAGTGHVLVADDDNHRVVEFLADGTYVRQIGSYGVGAGQFRFPYDVGIDARPPRQLYVADNNNHRVQAFDFATLAFQRTWGQFGTEVGDFGFTRALAAVADDPAGGVAVADTANNRVQTFAPDGAPTAAWGIAGRGPGYVTRPEGVAIDAAGNVHVADTLDHRIERLGADGAYLGQTGYISANSGYAAPAAGNGQLNTPGGVAVDRTAGRVWVADTANSRVQALGLDGTWQLNATGFNAPREIAVAPDGAVYVADTGNGRVQRRDPASGAWTTFTAGLSSPAGVAATSAAVYIADTGANRILRVAGATTTLPAPPGGLTAPTGLAAAAGAVYVADTGANRVLRFNEGPGTWDVIGTDGTGAGQFIAPHGLALDAAATTLVVADTGNDRLQRITLSGTPRAALVRLNAATAGTGTGSVLSAPAGIWCPTDCRQGYSSGAVVRLEARAASGSTFAGWSGACAGMGPCDVSMSGERSVTAAFVATGPPAPEPPAGPGPTSQPAPSGAANASVRDRTAPRLRGVSLRPRRLRAARRGATIAALASGATLRYALSERGALSIAIERADKRGRYRALRGRVRRTTAAGAHRLTFRARLGGRALRAGRYKLVLRASDVAGNRSAARRVAFTVVTGR